MLTFRHGGRPGATIIRLASLMSGLSLIAACSAENSGHATSSAEADPVQNTVELNSLCAAINETSVALSVTGVSEAFVTSAPLYPAGEQIAGCEYTNPAEPVGVLDITIEPTIQHGVNQFEKLQKDDSLTQLNVNGFEMVGSLTTLHTRFTNTNPSLVGASQRIDSILTASFRVSHGQPVETRPLTPDSYAAKMIMHVADDINSGKVYANAESTPGSATKIGPMLIDDQGRPVPNPTAIMAIFDMLNEGNVDLLSYSYGLGSDLSSDEWYESQVPYLNQTSVQGKIVQSMTVHPHCDPDCTYPGFVVTGWNSSTAREDAAMLGVDPAAVSDPTGKNSPVWRTVFLDSIGWHGAYAPGT